MALKADLEAAAAKASTVEEIVKVAMEACKEPADKEYALELLKQAEGDCSFPMDYIKVAEGFAIGLGDKSHAKELYEEAESECFEAIEYAELGVSYFRSLGDDKEASEIIDKAVRNAKKTNEFMLIAQYAKEIGDDEIAINMMDKVTGTCKTIADYKKLAESIIKDEESAKALYMAGKKLAGDIQGAVEFCEGLHSLFKDTKLAASILEGVAEDAQFTKDYVALARAYKNYAGDEERAKELLETGKDFAMQGEEFIDYALGCWSLFADKKEAIAGFEKGLNSVNDKNLLMDYARIAAQEINEPELAKKFYARAETKMTSAADLSQLAKTITDTLDDKNYASEIYTRAEQSITDPKDLMVLAGELIKNLGNKEHAKAIYKKSLESISKFPLLLELLGEIVKNIEDKDLARSVLMKANSLATGTPEMLDLANKVFDILNDTEFAAKVVETAEEIVTTLDEMKKVSENVKKMFPDDNQWLGRVSEKLDKREKNQDKYQEFQKREDKLLTFKEHMQLADEIIQQLDDKYYAKKILSKAEELLAREFFNFDKYRKLIISIKKYLDDSNWIKALYDYCVNVRIRFIFELKSVCKSLISDFGNKKEAFEISKKYLLSMEAKLSLAMDFLKLAEIAKLELHDKDYYGYLVDKAMKTAGDSYSLSSVAGFAIAGGNPSKAEECLKLSVELCNGYENLFNLMKRYIRMNFDSRLLKETYAGAIHKFSGPKEKLLWAEGTLLLFGDGKAAEKAYKLIEHDFADYEGNLRLKDSMENILQ